MEETNDFEKQLILLQEEGIKIKKWLKEINVADEYIGAAFEYIDGHQGIALVFEYKCNVEYLDNIALETSIAENVIDNRFSVSVFIYNEEDGEEYKNLFCVEIWLNE